MSEAITDADPKAGTSNAIASELSASAKPPRPWFLTDALLVALLPPLLYAVCFLYETGYLRYYGIPITTVLLPISALAQVAIRILATLCIAFLLLVLGDYMRTNLPADIRFRKVLINVGSFLSFLSPAYVQTLSSWLDTESLWIIAFGASIWTTMGLFRPSPWRRNYFSTRGPLFNLIFALSLIGSISVFGGTSDASRQQTFLVATPTANSVSSTAWIILRTYPDSTLLAELSPDKRKLTGVVRFISTQDMSAMDIQPLVLGHLPSPRPSPPAPAPAAR